jgi:hypothetical protein
VGKEVIDLLALDDLVQNERLKPPDLIKIDIEGGELYALKGARKLIEEAQPILMIEYLEKNFKEAGYRGEDILAELQRSNYAVYGVPDDFTDLKVYPINQFSEIEPANIIALPKDKESMIRGIM